MSDTIKDLQNEIYKLETQLIEYQKKEKNWGKEQEISVGVFKELERKIETLTASNNELKEKLLDKKEKKRKLKDLNTELQKDLRAVREEIKELEQKTITNSVNDNKVREENRTLKEANKKFKENSEKLFNDNKLLVQNYAKLEDKVVKQEEELKITNEKLLSQEAKNDLLEEKLLEEKDNLPADHTSCFERINELEEEKENILEITSRTRDEQGEEIEALEDENIELNNQLDTVEDLIAEKDRVIFQKDQTIQELISENIQAKLGISHPETKQSQFWTSKPGFWPKNRIISMNERDKQIIQQAKAHLEPLTNAKTLRERILEVENKGGKEDFWELHTELTHAGLYLDKLIQFYQGDLDNVHQYTYTLGAILRGERLLNDK